MSNSKRMTLRYGQMETGFIGVIETPVSICQCQ